MNSSTHVSRSAAHGRGPESRVIVVQLHQVLQLVSDLQTQVTTVATIRMVRSLNVVAVDAVVHPHRCPTAVNQRPVLSRGRNG